MRGWSSLAMWKSKKIPHRHLTFPLNWCGHTRAFPLSLYSLPVLVFFFWAFMCYSLCNYFLKATMWEEHSAFSPIHSFQQVFLHRLSHWKLNSSFKAYEQVSLPALLSCYSISLDILQSQSHLVMSRYYNKICNI